jgi:molecular chaperone GrpE (heat shock protein)
MSPELIDAFRDFLRAGTVWNKHNYSFDEVAAKTCQACLAAGIQTADEANDMIETLADEQAKMEALEELVAHDRKVIGSYNSNKGLRGQNHRLNRRLQYLQARLAKMPRISREPVETLTRDHIENFISDHHDWLDSLDVM